MGAPTVVPTRLPIHVVRHGHGDDVFVLLHGFGGTSYSWRHWIPELSARGSVLTIDLKGFGRSPPGGEGGYGPETQAELVATLIRELDLRRITIIGHSYGGGVGLLTALELLDTGRIGRLVLVGAAAYRQRLPPLVPLSRRPRLSRLLVRWVGAKRIIRWTLRSVVYDRDTVDEEQVAAYARPLEDPGRLGAIMAAGRSIVPDRIDELVEGYHTLDVPTLLLWGEHERVIPLWVGERLARELPDARLVVLERCGHLPQEERPHASWRVVAEFLDAHPLPIERRLPQIPFPPAGR